MTKRPRVLTAFVLSVVFLAGLIAFAPASLMNVLLRSVSGGQLWLAQTQGSLWQGSGVALLRHQSGYILLGNYQWTLKPLNMALHLRNEDRPPAIFHFHPLKRQLDIENLHVKFPAAMLERLSNQLRIYQLQGALYLHATRLYLGVNGMEGQIVLDWQDAYSGLSLVRPLGNYRILLRGEGKKIDAALTTLSGRLILTAEGSYVAKTGLQMRGTARATPGADKMLNELLHHIGPEVAPGVFGFALMSNSSVSP